MNLVKYWFVKVEKINQKECREGHQIIIIIIIKISIPDPWVSGSLGYGVFHHRAKN
jgi:hypothetical protein